MGYPFVSGQPKHLDAGVNAARTARAKVLFARGKNAQQRHGLDRQTTGKRAAAERSEARSGVKRRKRWLETHSGRELADP